MKPTKKARIVVFADGEMGLQIIRIMLKHDPGIICGLITLPGNESCRQLAQEYSVPCMSSIRPAHVKSPRKSLSERKHFHLGLVAGDSEIRISEIGPGRHSWKRIAASEITPRALFVVPIPKVEVV
jgi:hypothetical protein